MNSRSLQIGGTRPLTGVGKTVPFSLPVDHLMTHGVVLGMTGSGKSGLAMVLVEETLQCQVPVLMIDVKGDLPNLLLAFPSFAAREFEPWIDADSAKRAGDSVEDCARRAASSRQQALEGAGIDEAKLRAFHDAVDVRVITPGTAAGEMLHLLSPLERRSPLWDKDPEAARDSLSASVSLVLRLLGRDPDPAKSRDHVLLSVLAERRLRAGESSSLDVLLQDLEEPPIDEIGAMSLDAFLSRHDRRTLASSLNALLASPTFSSWRQGGALDVGEWLAPRADGRTPAVILSVAHLDDEERSLVLGMVLEQLLAWMRTLPGANTLRALVVFDEIYGFLPPHPANPPTKRPMVALMKQARAFGIGVVVATQNPMDLDYRALSNAGLWCVGRLQTDADRARVIEALVGNGSGVDEDEVRDRVKRLGPRWFVLRDVHASGAPVLLETRAAMSWLRGPMTRAEVRRVCLPSGG